jgi:hypothetical protein
VVRQDEAVAAVRTDRVPDHPVPQRVDGLAADALVLQWAADLRQSPDADHEAPDRIAQRVPFLRVEEHERLVLFEGAEEAVEQGLLPPTAEYPRRSKRRLLIVGKLDRKLVGERLLTLHEHPVEGHGERGVARDRDRRRS